MNTLGKVISWFFSIYFSVGLGIFLFLSYTESKRYRLGAIAFFLMLLLVFPPLWSLLARKHNVRINWLVKFILLIFCYILLLSYT
jgi:hypothetical protein